MEVKR
jgi:hypothetical protein